MPFDGSGAFDDAEAMGNTEDMVDMAHIVYEHSLCE